MSITNHKINDYWFKGNLLLINNVSSHADSIKKTPIIQTRVNELKETTSLNFTYEAENSF